MRHSEFTPRNVLIVLMYSHHANFSLFNCESGNFVV